MANSISKFSESLQHVADLNGWQPRVDEINRAQRKASIDLLRPPKGIQAGAWRTAYLFAWEACCRWDQVEPKEQAEVIQHLSEYNGAGKVLAEAVNNLDGSTEHKGTPEGVRRALLRAPHALELIEAGELDGGDWETVVLDALSACDVSDPVEDALGFFQIAIWALDSGRLEGRKFIAFYAEPVALPYEGAASEFDSFLFGSFVSGVPFLIEDPWIGRNLPTRFEWLTAEREKRVEELASDLEMGLAYLDKHLERLDLEIWDGGNRALIKTRQGYILGQKLPDESGRLFFSPDSVGLDDEELEARLMAVLSLLLERYPNGVPSRS